MAGDDCISTPSRTFSPTGKLSHAIAIAALYGLSAWPALADLGAVPGVLPASIVLGLGLVLLSVIDLGSGRLPDLLTIPLLLAGLAASALLRLDDLPMRILAAMVGFAALYAAGEVYRRLRDRPGIGLGDAKLLAASGAWLGLGGLPSVVLIACAGGLLGALILAAMGRPVGLATRIPFGPFLAFGTWVVWLYGQIG